MSAFSDAFGKSWKDWASGKYGLSPIDMLLPGSTAISKAFDITGERAAQNQYNNQLALQHDAQAYNAEQAQLQRDFEESMASTAIQRQKADIEAAGLNPYIMMSGGNYSGAAVPSGSSASSSEGSASMANNKLAAAAGAFAIFLRMFLTKGK